MQPNRRARDEDDDDDPDDEFYQDNSEQSLFGTLAKEIEEEERDREEERNHQPPEQQQQQQQAGGWRTADRSRGRALQMLTNDFMSTKDMIDRLRMRIYNNNLLGTNLLDKKNAAMETADELYEERHNIEAAIASMEAKLARTSVTDHKNRNQLVDAIDQAKSDLADAIDERTTMLRTAAKIQQDMDAVGQRVDAMKAEKQELEGHLDQIKFELDQLQHNPEASFFAAGTFGNNAHLVDQALMYVDQVREELEEKYPAEDRTPAEQSIMDFDVERAIDFDPEGRRRPRAVMRAVRQRLFGSPTFRLTNTGMEATGRFGSRDTGHQQQRQQNTTVTGEDTRLNVPRVAKWLVETLFEEFIMYRTLHMGFHYLVTATKPADITVRKLVRLAGNFDPHDVDPLVYKWARYIANETYSLWRNEYLHAMDYHGRLVDPKDDLAQPVSMLQVDKDIIAGYVPVATKVMEAALRATYGDRVPELYLPTNWDFGDTMAAQPETDMKASISFGQILHNSVNAAFNPFSLF